MIVLPNFVTQVDYDDLTLHCLITVVLSQARMRLVSFACPSLIVVHLVDVLTVTLTLYYCIL